VAEAGKVGVGDLLTKFFTDALVVFAALQAAGAVAAGALQAITNGLDHFLIIIEPYSHGVHFLSGVIIREIPGVSRWLGKVDTQEDFRYTERN